MTTDIIDKLAREAGLIADIPCLAPHDYQMRGYARFAALVAEECAKVAERSVARDEAAQAIRERFRHE